MTAAVARGDLTLSRYRNVVLADRIRAQLINQLGGKCSECGVVEGEVHLEINHIYGRDWMPSKQSRYHRWLRYRRESNLKLVDLRCPECNQVYRPIRNYDPNPF